MELLIGIIAFDVIVYLLLRMLTKRGQSAESAFAEQHPARSISTRFAPTHRYPSRLMGRGVFGRPGNWPRYPNRPRRPFS